MTFKILAFAACYSLVNILTTTRQDDVAVFVTIMLSLNSSCKVFKPDKTNGIEIQTEREAKLERERREKEAALQAPPPTPGSRNRYNK